LPDFTTLDPTIIAQFWIYFIGSMIVGIVIGWIVKSFLTKRELTIFNSEKEQFKTEKASFLDKKEEYESIKTKYESLLNDLKKNDEYWLYKKRNTESNDIDPSVLLHNGLKKK